MKTNENVGGIEERRHLPRYTLIQARTKDPAVNRLIDELEALRKEEVKLLASQKELTLKQRDLTNARRSIAAKQQALRADISVMKKKGG